MKTIHSGHLSIHYPHVVVDEDGNAFILLRLGDDDDRAYTAKVPVDSEVVTWLAGRQVCYDAEIVITIREVGTKT